MPIKSGKQRKPKAHKPTGPKPETLRIEGNWKEAMKKALGKKRPAQGWPQKEPRSEPKSQ